MKKQVHPGIAAAIVVVLLTLAGLFYYSKTATPEAHEADPLGPGGKLMREQAQKSQVPGRSTPDVLEAVKQQQKAQEAGKR